MIDPVSVGVVVVAMRGAKHIGESVLAGNDPSLAVMATTAFASVSKLPQAKAGDQIIATKDIGRVVSNDPLVQEKIVLEKYVDQKYVSHGNLEDAWVNLKQGEVTFDTFLLAMVDIVDAMTLGIFRPMLLEIKVNPHIKAREVHYCAEVTYDKPEINKQKSIGENGLKTESTTTTTNKITQVQRISFEISPDIFEKGDVSFAEGVAKIKDANIAERTIVYTRMDKLCENDLRTFSNNGVYKLTRQSQRLQTYEMAGSPEQNGTFDIPNAMEDPALLTADKEQINSQIHIERTSTPGLQNGALERAGLPPDSKLQVNDSQKTVVNAGQQEEINHIAGTRTISSVLSEESQRSTMASTVTNNRLWSREDVRLKEANGNVDLFELKEISADEFVNEGATLLNDKARVKDTLAVVDISNSGEVVNFVNQETKRSWLIRESDITRTQTESTEFQKWRIASQDTEFDYLKGAQEIIDAKIQDKDITIKTVTDIEESKNHWRIFGWNSKKLLGEATVTTTTPTVTTQTYVKDLELSKGHNIFDAFGMPEEKLLAKGATILNADNSVEVAHGKSLKERSFEEGKISYVPFVGGIGHLASKSMLGGGVSCSDVFWAAMDVVEIVTTTMAIVAAVPSGGATIAAQAEATAAKTAAKAAAKTTAKAIAKGTSKAVVKGTPKALAKGTTKAVIKGTVKIGGKQTSKMLAQTTAKHVTKTTGRVAIKGAGKAGAKAVGEATVRSTVKVSSKAGAKAVARAGSKAATKAGAKASAKHTGKVTLRKVGTKTATQNTAKTAAKVATRTGFKPNTTYIKNGYKYITDAQGRVIKATGKLKNVPGVRNPANQKLAATLGKIGDEGGHLIPAAYGGPGSMLNHVPQTRTVNRSIIKRIENEMGRALKAGHKVEYTVMPHYPNPGTLRPDKFTIRYTIDGVQKTRRIPNV